MDKDVQARLAAIEEKVDLLLRHIQIKQAVEYTIDFSNCDGPEVERRLKSLCTKPPIRGD